VSKADMPLLHRIARNVHPPIAFMRIDRVREEAAE
jgi:hypothetical protein